MFNYIEMFDLPGIHGPSKQVVFQDSFPYNRTGMRLFAQLTPSFAQPNPSTHRSARSVCPSTWLPTPSEMSQTLRCSPSEWSVCNLK